MIKRLNILLLALFFSGLSMAQTDTDKTDLIYQQWDDSFKSYLLNHPHPYVQTIGLNLSSPELPLRRSYNEDSKLSESQQSYVDHINQLAKSNSLSSETIFLLLSLCSNSAISHACHRQHLINKHQQSYPYDMSVYFETFNSAINNDDASMAEYLIKNMRDAKYITDMTVLPKVLKSAIKQFMDNNPLPRSVLIKQLEGLVDVDASVSNNDLNQAFYHIRISAIKMALPIPAYKTLTDYCSSEPNSTQACVDIADTLITQGKDLIAQLIGHRLKVKAYEKTLETDRLVKAESENDKFRSYYECITSALSINNRHADYLDVTYAKIWFSSNNELQRFKSAAQYLYKKGLTAGYTDVKNPAECE